MTPQQRALTDERRSGMRLYRELAVGEAGLGTLLYYELCTTFFSGLGGLLGYGARSVLYRPLFRSCGRRPAIGRHVVIRNPKAITIGKKLLLDDYAVLDTRGADGAIELGDFVSVGRFTSIVSKHGRVTFENGVNVGSYCRIATQSRVRVGESTLVAAYCYIGPGNHQHTDDGRPLIEQPMDIRGGVDIGKNVWIGARTTILDGVTIGDEAIVGAHSLVREDVPPGAVVVGSPARVVRTR